MRWEQIAISQQRERERQWALFPGLSPKYSVVAGILGGHRVLYVNRNSLRGECVE